MNKILRDNWNPESEETTPDRINRQSPDTIVKPGDKCQICEKRKAVTRCYYCKRQICEMCIRWDDRWGERRATCGNCIMP